MGRLYKFTLLLYRLHMIVSKWCSLDFICFNKVVKFEKKTLLLTNFLFSHSLSLDDQCPDVSDKGLVGAVTSTVSASDAEDCHSKCDGFVGSLFEEGPTSGTTVCECIVSYSCLNNSPGSSDPYSLRICDGAGQYFCFLQKMCVESVAVQIRCSSSMTEVSWTTHKICKWTKSQDILHNFDII